MMARSLSCDDTKLQAALCSYFDQERDGYCILGSTGEPLLIANPAGFNDMLKDHDIQKATKVTVISLFW